MFEPHHQLEARILSSYFDVSTYPGEESLQALTKGDENLLLRPPYPTPHCSRTTDVLSLGTQTVITATGHLAIDEWMLILCRVNSHAVIQVFTQFLLICSALTPRVQRRSQPGLISPTSPDPRPQAQVRA